MIPILTSDALINQPVNKQICRFPYLACNKFIFLEVISLGLYSFFWWYTLWQHYKKNNPQIKYLCYTPCIVLALLSPLLGNLLFRELANNANAEGVRFDWDPTIISIIYFIGCALFITSAFSHLHFPFLLVTWSLRFLPLYFIQMTINQICEKYPPDISLNSTTNFNSFFTLGGGILWSIILIVTLILSLPPLTLARFATKFQSYTIARHILLKEAYKGNAQAQAKLATLYRLGLLEDDNNNAAIRWYERAANQNDPHAIFSLGKIYQYGLGIQQDYTKAMYYYQLAVQYGINSAKTNLAKLYEHSSNNPAAIQIATQLYLQAAEAGDPQAQFLLALHHLQGKGVPYDIQKTLEWFGKAAAQGCPCAQNALGILLMQGTGGITQDQEQATAWFQKAIKNPKLKTMIHDGQVKNNLSQNDYMNSYVKYMRLQYGNDDTPTVTHLSLPQQAAAHQLGKEIEKKCMSHYDEDEAVEV